MPALLNNTSILPPVAAANSFIAKETFQFFKARCININSTNEPTHICKKKRCSFADTGRRTRNKNAFQHKELPLICRHAEIRAQLMLE
jgi:hypothetical protein